MFERYTEKARRTVFFARLEASESGSLRIETEHLLLGLAKEGLEHGLAFPPETAESIRREILATIAVGNNRTGTSIDMPLSGDARRALQGAARESEEMGHRVIHTGHLLLGLMEVPDCLAARVLRAHGFEAEALRAGIRASTGREPTPE